MRRRLCCCRAEGVEEPSAHAVGASGVESTLFRGCFGFAVRGHPSNIKFAGKLPFFGELTDEGDACIGLDILRIGCAENLWVRVCEPISLAGVYVFVNQPGQGTGVFKEDVEGAEGSVV